MEKIFKFNDVECFYKMSGQGTTVMLVHGFIEEGSMWDDLAETLADQFEVIVPDLPGFGKSQLADGGAALSMELYADYLHEILKAENVKELIMLGHSMGGYVTLSFAEKHENMLRAFGLINSHCFADNSAKKNGRLKGNDFIKKHGTAEFIKELYNSIFHEKFKKNNGPFIESLIDKALRYKPEAVIAANTAMLMRSDKSAVLKNARVPVLLMNGKDDESAPLEYTSQPLMFALSADAHFFSECKHMCIFEKKDVATDVIRNFCAGLTA